MNRFEYVSPTTIKGVVSILRKHSKRAMILAGGTDLLVKMKDRSLTPEVIVDIKRIPGLDQIRYDKKNGLSIGACVTMREAENSPILNKHYQALVEGSKIVGSVQIRNRATLIGNICNAAPSADVAPGFIVVGAKVKIAGPKRTRIVQLGRFFTGPGKTILRTGEWVTHILVPSPPPRTGSAYIRHTIREAMDIAVVGVGVALTMSKTNGRCKEAKISLGAVAPTPIRAIRAEKLLIGQELNEKLIDQAARIASEESRPISDQRGSAEFRRDLTRVLTERMVTRAFNAATV